MSHFHKTLGILLILAVLAGIALVGSMPYGLAQNGTTENGIISSDAIWTRGGSPYSLTGPVAVAQGITLTIQPGAMVNLNSYYMQVNGTLIAIGTNANPIQISGGSSMDVNNPFGPFTPAGITFYPSSTSWNEQDGSGCIISNAVFNSTQIAIDASSKITNTQGAALLIEGGSSVISDNSHLSILEWGGSPSISGNTLGSGVTVSAGSPTITDNTITGGGNFAIALGSRYALDETDVSFVSGNTITGNYNMCIIASGEATIQNNLLLIQSSLVGIKASGPQSDITIQDNTVVGSSTGILVDSTMTGNLTLANNNFEEISRYLIDCETPNNINAANNWWGTTNQSVISQSIRDSKDDFNLGTVTFVPFLTAPNPQAPTIPTQTSTPIPTASPSPSPALSFSSPTPSSTSASTTKPAGPLAFSVPATVFVTVVAILLAAIASLLVLLYARHRKSH